jgi:hypothetical protein
MKCVAWTQGSNNTAYVSHIQTYLQGSDYWYYYTRVVWHDPF